MPIMRVFTDGIVEAGQILVGKAAVRTIPDLLRLYRIRECNYVLVGDGSCTGNWNYEAGWACTVINLLLDERQVIYGGASMGTNILSEMMAYVYAFHWLARKKDRSVIYVDVFTD